MNRIYAFPVRVYLCLGVLAFVGIICGFQLPISLFPNSSKPIIGADISYGNLTAAEFIAQHGNSLESQLLEINAGATETEKIRAFYEQRGARYEVEFKWGGTTQIALKEVEALIHAYSHQLTEEVRNQISIYPQNSNTGFFSVSFYSSTRTLDDLYQILEPILMPGVAKVKDAFRPTLWNPTEKEVRIELNQERMAAFQLMPKNIDDAIQGSLVSHNGGSVNIGIHKLPVQVLRMVNSIDDVNHILVPTPGNRFIHLTDVAKIDYDVKTANSYIFKTSGSASLILWARPRPNGNVKRMSEEIYDVIQKTMPLLPKDIEYKVLVDPSEFIRSAITNIFHEVVMGGLLAVLVLYLFIGDFKNTVTAAIEIPLSIVMAFILMKVFGTTLNLISLGGLALSAGMNVDASVVVMENIFRHFEKLTDEARRKLDFDGKLKLVVQSVNEVKLPVIGSTIASLVVFVPLAFTSDLTYAILGDLAKAVVFSHGFSAVVALVLVPTVRLHLMSKRNANTKLKHSPIDKQINALENFYVNSLRFFIERPKLQMKVFSGLVLLLVALAIFVLPRLPKEVIGKPDTDWLFVEVHSHGNTLLKQMESLTDRLETQLGDRYGSQISYTFTQISQPNSAWVMARLRDKQDMNRIWKDMENYFSNTPFLHYTVGPWNPAELPIPNPPQMRINIRGGQLADRAKAARDIYQLMEEGQVFPRLWSEPDSQYAESIILKPNLPLWSSLRAKQSDLRPADLADLIRVMTVGRTVGQIMIDGNPKDISLHYQDDARMTAEDIQSIPIGVEGKIIPIKALTKVEVEETVHATYQEDKREMFYITGRENEGDSTQDAPKKLKKAQEIVEKWRAQQIGTNALPKDLFVTFEDAAVDIHDAMNQLSLTLLVSVSLIFIILVMQFGDIMNALIVFMAVPLGFIGVLISLFVFRSTLSLNSILGVILLNGIAVANSIILVDFLRQRVEHGLTPLNAALDAAKQRLRPIFITSLTTILGMLPVALGMGEGGRILQPLGIAVSGGLWVSMGLTLFVVPALQVRYLNWKNHRSHTS